MDRSQFRQSDSRVFESLDRDHNELEEVIALLDEALACQFYDATLFDEALAQLIDDTARHFRKEEAWMRRLDYPALKDHSHQHSLLLAALIDFRRGFVSNPLRSNAYVIRGFVDDWLVHHMNEVDQAFEFFARGEGVAPSGEHRGSA